MKGGARSEKGKNWGEKKKEKEKKKKERKKEALD